MTAAPPSVDPVEVRRALELLHPEGETFEIRILRAKDATWNGHRDARTYPTAFGYFRGPVRPAQELPRVLGSASFLGIYTTLNSVRPELFSRAADVLQPCGPKDSTTSDADIPRRRWLLVDLDFKRPAGISTSDEEHEAALALGRRIAQEMTTRHGWPSPVLADSGNGAHLLWQVSLPGDDGGLVKRVLARLQKDFAADGVDVDQSVFNPARITKLYGTLAGKGSNTKERPHRMSRILEIPEDLRPVPSVLLEDYAGPVQQAPPPKPEATTDGTDFESLIRKRWPDAKKKTTADGTTIYELPECPWEPEHRGSAFAGRRANGALFAGCQGNRCQGKGWADFRELLGIRRYEPELQPVVFEIEDHRTPERPYLPEAALYGVAGDYVRAVSPYTEADPAGILGAVLGEAGCLIGRGPHTFLGSTRHGVNENFLLIGPTSEGRKGTAQDDAERLFRAAGLYVNEISGLGSGEGLVYEIRDETEADPGQPDKRLLIRESEFAHVLRVIQRDGTTLSPILRLAWDGKTLRNKVKGKAHSHVASDPHISVLGQITPSELRRLLTESETANGLGNRFVCLYVRREQLMPDGGRLPDSEMAPLAARLRDAIEFASQAGEINRDAESSSAHRKVYQRLTSDRVGLFGEMTARGAQHVTRLAMIYALLDRSRVIRFPHFRAALALWEYAEGSARYVFGTSVGDPIADDILAELKHLGEQGMTRDAIRKHFSGHVYGARLDDALDVLSRLGLAVKARRRPSGKEKGRTPEVWFHRDAFESLGVKSVESVQMGVEAA